VKRGKPLTTGDVARYCQVSKVAVLNWIKRGKLQAYVTPGGHHRIDRMEFKTFLLKYGMPFDEDFLPTVPERPFTFESDFYIKGF